METFKKQFRELWEEKREYLIVDNFQPIEFLRQVRSDALLLEPNLEQAAVGRDESKMFDRDIRSDRKGFVTSYPKEGKGEAFPNLCQLISHQQSFLEVFNEFIPEEQKLNSLETMLACYDGHGEVFKSHKDAFKIDENNVKNNQRLRKISMITYFPEDNDHIPRDQVGNFRIELKEQYIEVRPKMGRTIIFKSENLLHSVLPTTGYKRLALTTWFSHIHRDQKKLGQKTVLDPDGLIFISIPAYRDSETHYTVKSCIESAENIARLRIAVFIQASREEDEKTCFIDELQKKYPKLIKVEEVHYSEARNVYYARSRCQKMYAGEDFALQIDSHMRFCKNWDSLLIK